MYITSIRLFSAILCIAAFFPLRAQLPEVLDLAARRGYDRLSRLRAKAVDLRPDQSSWLAGSNRSDYTVSSPTEVAITSSPLAESEVTAAIHPIDTNRVVVSTMRTTGNEEVDETEIDIYFTDDGGLSWERSDFRPMRASSLFAVKMGGGDPVLTYDAEGRVHLVWLRLEFSFTLDIKASILHAYSEDGGRTWTEDAKPVEEYTVGLSDPGNVSIGDKPWIVADTEPGSPYYGSLYLMHTQLAFESADSVPYQIIMRRWSRESGWAENSTVAISSEQLLFCHFPHAAIGVNGEVHLLVAGASVSDPYTALYHSVSSDAGESFGPPNRVSYFDLSCFLQEETADPCVDGVVASRTTSSSYIYANPSTRELYAIWHSSGFREAVTEGVDVYFSRSDDAGRTWSPPIVVNQDQDPATDNFLPTGTLSRNGGFALTWYDQRATPDSTHYYGRWYDSHSGGFGPETVISSQPTSFGQVGLRNGGFGVGEYNGTVSTNNTLIPVWADGRNNDGNLEIFVARVARESGQIVSVRQIGRELFGLTLATNPVTSVLRASLHLPPGPAPNSIQAQIYDGMGRLLTTQRLAPLSADGIIEISVRQYASGMYYLHVTDTSGAYATQRFMKN
jgi:hypothetical protein